VHRDPGAAHDIAVEAGRQLYDGVFGRIHHATAEGERAAFEFLARHRDQKYSFTGCLSFVIMDANRITEALTVDADFPTASRPDPDRFGDRGVVHPAKAVTASRPIRSGVGRAKPRGMKQSRGGRWP
jgi:hypothetical protein